MMRNGILIVRLIMNEKIYCYTRWWITVYTFCGFCFWNIIHENIFTTKNVEIRILILHEEEDLIFRYFFTVSTILSVRKKNKFYGNLFISVWCARASLYLSLLTADLTPRVYSGKTFVWKVKASRTFVWSWTMVVFAVLCVQIWRKRWLKCWNFIVPERS